MGNGKPTKKSASNVNIGDIEKVGQLKYLVSNITY